MKLTLLLLLSLCLLSWEVFDKPLTVEAADEANIGTAWIESPVERNTDRDPAASPFKVIGGYAITAPCCVSHGSGRMICFRIDLDSKIQQIIKEGEVYGEWEEIPGIQTNELECVSRREGTVDVLSLDSDSRVVSKTSTWGRWSQTWTTLNYAYQFIEVPSCTSRTPSTVECMARGFNHLGHYIQQTDGRWDGTFLRFDCQELTSPFDCGSTSKDLHCFAVGPDSHLWQKTWDPRRGWQPYFDVGGSVQGKPQVVTWSGFPNVGVFALEKTNGMTYRGFTTRWHPWKPLGGEFESVPQCVTFSREVHCFGIGRGSKLYRRTFEYGKWGSWIAAEGTFLDGLACVATDIITGEVTCLLRGLDRAIGEVVYTFKETFC